MSVKHVDQPAMGDFKLPDGKIDWPRWQAADKDHQERATANGEYCYRCNAYMLWPKGTRSLCTSCERLAELPEEREHSDFIRCPFCKRIFDPNESGDNYEIYSEGEHTATCYECEHDFKFETHVSYSFTSPAIEARSANTEQPQPATTAEKSANK